MKRNTKEKIDFLHKISMIKKVCFIISFICFIVGGMLFSNILFKTFHENEHVHKAVREAKSPAQPLLNEYFFNNRNVFMPIGIAIISMGVIFIFIGIYTEKILDKKNGQKDLVGDTVSPPQI